jgi:hypothetical protein
LLRLSACLFLCVGILFLSVQSVKSVVAFFAFHSPAGNSNQNMLPVGEVS